MPRHETPIWLDDLLEREEISLEEYYNELGVSQEYFWELFWDTDSETEEEFLYYLSEESSVEPEQPSP